MQAISKSKPLTEMETAVENYITQNCGASYVVHYAGEQNRDGWTCDAWKFTAKRGRVSESFDYFTGTWDRETIRGYKAVVIPGAKHVRGQWEAQRPQVPPIAGLLHSLITDSSAAEQTFAAWCNEFGYDSDSRKVIATYEACQKGYDQMARLFTRGERETLQEN
ncbi:hypothetical protein Acf1_00003 [Acidovorax phage ACF1]|nr:hypothetical protein Acf1_00003 [Acidovorax phage ACF1]